MFIALRVGARYSGLRGLHRKLEKFISHLRLYSLYGDIRFSSRAVKVMAVMGICFHDLISIRSIRQFVESYPSTRAPSYINNTGVAYRACDQATTAIRASEWATFEIEPTSTPHTF